MKFTSALAERQEQRMERMERNAQRRKMLHHAIRLHAQAMRLNVAVMRDLARESRALQTSNQAEDNKRPA